MADPQHLTRAERIAVAQLSGTALYHATGRGEGNPVAALHEISADPVLLGVAAGTLLVRFERNAEDVHAAIAVRHLRDAGADEQTIADEAVKVRYRRDVPRPSW